MLGTRTWSDWASLALIGATLAAGLALRPELPAEVAIHFSAAGEPDNYFGRDLAVLSMPALMLATLLFMQAAGRYDPPEDPQVLRVVSLATMLLLAAVQAFIFAWNLGYEPSFDLFLAGVAVWMIAVVGYAVSKEGVDLG